MKAVNEEGKREHGEKTRQVLLSGKASPSMASEVMGGTTAKLLLLHSDVYNDTRPQICKSQNRKNHGSAEFCSASAGNDISVTHRAQAEEAARQLRKGERSGREQPFSNPPALHHRNHLHISVPVLSFSHAEDMLYLAQIFLVTRFQALVTELDGKAVQLEVGTLTIKGSVKTHEPEIACYG